METWPRPSVWGPCVAQNQDLVIEDTGIHDGKNSLLSKDFNQTAPFSYLLKPGRLALSLSNFQILQNLVKNGDQKSH